MVANVSSGFVPTETALTAKTPTRLSWGAIFGGVVIAIAMQLVLGILGAGIGFTLVDPVQGTTPGAAGFGIGAGIYWLITTVLSLGAGGYVAARVAGVHDRFDALVHGLVVWGVTLILTLYLLTSAVGGIIGGAFRTVGAVAGAAGTTVSAAAPQASSVAGIDEGDVRSEAAAYLSDAPNDPPQMTPEQAQKEIAKQLPALARGGTDGQQAESRVVDIVAAQRKISRPEAQAQVTRAKQQFVKTKNDTIATAKSATDKAAGAAAGTSFVLVLALLIGAAASGFGATAATRRRLR
jgi:voltage-gated potassium channel Kch